MKGGSLKNAITSSDYVRREIKKIGLKYIHDMTKASNNAISAFYSDYKPLTYQRVFGLKPIYKIKTSYEEPIMTIVFTFDSNYITGHKNSGVIFNGPFMQGYHGGPIKRKSDSGVEEGSFSAIKTHKSYSPAPKMSPSPYEMIEDFFYSYDI